MLTKERFEEEQRSAFEMILRVWPSTNLDYRAIEIADFSLTNPRYKDRANTKYRGNRKNLDETTFKSIGLEPLVLINEPDRPVLGGISPGYCSKILVWKPEQFLPSHRHQTVHILRKGTNLDFLIDLQGVNPEFGKVGGMLEGYPLEKYDYFVTKSVEGLTEGNETVLGIILSEKDYTIQIGKTETFKVLYGNGWYIGSSINHPDQQALTEPIYKKVPESQRRYLYQGDDLCAIPMVNGGNYTLPTNTSHAVVAGEQGMVALEVSAGSWDPADIFSCKDIRRETKILMPDNRIITASQYFKEKNIPIIRG